MVYSGSLATVTDTKFLRALEINLHTKLPSLIVTHDVSFNCVRFYNISKNRYCFTAV